MPLNHVQKRTTAILVALMTFAIPRADAQGPYNRDSLQQLISHPKEGTSTVMSLLRFGDLFRSEQPDSAVHYYEAARQLAAKLHWNEGRAEYISHIIHVLNNQGKYQQALELCQDALRIYSATGTKADLTRAYNNVANEYQYLGDFSSAAENYLQAAHLAESLPERKFVKVIDNNLSSVFFTLQRYDKSYTYANQSYNIARELRDTEGIALSLVNLGVNEIHLNKTDSALQHFKQVVALSDLLHDYTFACDGYTNMGSIHINLHQPELAKADYERVRLLAEKNDNPNYKILALAGLSDVYAALHQWKPAATYAEQAAAIAGDIRDRNSLVQLYDKAAKVHEGMGDWKGALSFRNRFEALNDSLLNEKTRDHINELETRYQGAKKDRQLAEEHLQLERTQATVHTRNLQLYALAAGLALLSVLFVLGWRLFRQRQKLNRQSLAALEKEREVAVLKGVLRGQEEERQRIAKEMHDDMGAGLTTILYLGQSLEAAPQATTGISQKIVHTTTELVETMNEIIWSMNKRYDTLEDLVAYIRRKGGALLEYSGRDYSMDIPDTVPSIPLSGEARRNIFLIVKEALHNAIKHSDAAMITLGIQIDERLRIQVRDNGRGLPVNGTQKPGNGLNNMQERAKALGGTLQIVNDGGTRVLLDIPL